MASVPPLSDEQRRAVDHARQRRDLAVVARAGSGKTHTLRAMAEATAERRALLLAFNRSVARDARARLPRSARASTVHGLAYRAVVAHDPRMREKLRRDHEQVGDRIWLEAAGFDPADPAAEGHLAALRAILRRFLSDDAERPNERHVPAELAAALEDELGASRWRDRRRWLLLRTERLWHRIADPDDPLPLFHDGYLKLFAQRRAPAAADLLLIDEAQDLAPVTLGWLKAQSAQTILVGDPAQRIYGWRGAVDAMAASGHPEVALTRSFRFGPEIASVACAVLRVLAPGTTLVGAGGTGRVVWNASGSNASQPNVSKRGASERGASDHAAPPLPRAVLCRGNAGVFEAVLEHADLGVHVVGGLDATLAELETAHRHWQARDATWQRLERAAELSGGSLRTVTSLVERFGDDLPPLLARARSATAVRASDAAVTISTIHRAKGREWDHVELWGDLARIPDGPDALAAAPDPERSRAEANLLYVAVTRARRSLWLGRLRDDLRSLLRGSGDGS